MYLPDHFGFKAIRDFCQFASVYIKLALIAASCTAVGLRNTAVGLCNTGMLVPSQARHAATGETVTSASLIAHSAGLQRSFVG